MAHRIIIGNDKEYAHNAEHPATVATIEYEVDDSMTLSEEVALYREKAKYYRKLLNLPVDHE